MLQKAGVIIIAGTDAGYLNSFDYPGISLHTELALMVKYGLTPLEALQSSIINGPLYFNKQGIYGKIANGYVADLLLLDENPLIKISNTEKIHAIVKSGQFYSRAKLDALLNETQRKASESKIKPLK